MSSRGQPLPHLWMCRVLDFFPVPTAQKFEVSLDYKTYSGLYTICSNHIISLILVNKGNTFFMIVLLCYDEKET